MSVSVGERLLAGFVVLGALAVAIGAPIWWGEQRAAKPEDNPWHDTVFPREKPLLDEFPDIVQRRYLTLNVRMAAGGSKTFWDEKYSHRDECGFHHEDVNRCIAYSVWEISPDRRYVTLWVAHYEDGSAILIDRVTGTLLEFPSIPRLSPDGRHWAMVDDDDANRSGGISVLANERESPRIIASDDQGFCSYEAWDAADAFLIKCYDEEKNFESEFRVTWNEKGQLLKAATGRVFGP
jgi:hypothetical protein